MTPQETARAILALYDGKPERWTQKHYARDAEGFEAGIYSASATCWCLFGAADKVAADARGDGPSAGDDFIAYVNEKIAEWPPHWNDAPERTFADVVSLLERIAAEPTP